MTRIPTISQVLRFKRPGGYFNSLIKNHRDFFL